MGRKSRKDKKKLIQQHKLLGCNNCTTCVTGLCAVHSHHHHVHQHQEGPDGAQCPHCETTKAVIASIQSTCASAAAAIAGVGVSSFVVEEPGGQPSRVPMTTPIVQHMSYTYLDKEFKKLMDSIPLKNTNTVESIKIKKFSGTTTKFAKWALRFDGHTKQLCSNIDLGVQALAQIKIGILKRFRKLIMIKGPVNVDAESKELSKGMTQTKDLERNFERQNDLKKELALDLANFKEACHHYDDMATSAENSLDNLYQDWLISIDERCEEGGVPWLRSEVDQVDKDEDDPILSKQQKVLDGLRSVKPKDVTIVNVNACKNFYHSLTYMLEHYESFPHAERGAMAKRVLQMQRGFEQHNVKTKKLEYDCLVASLPLPQPLYK